MTIGYKILYKNNIQNPRLGVRKENTRLHGKTPISLEKLRKKDSELQHSCFWTTGRVDERESNAVESNDDDGMESDEGMWWTPKTRSFKEHKYVVGHRYFMR